MKKLEEGSNILVVPTKKRLERLLKSANVDNTIQNNENKIISKLNQDYVEDTARESHSVTYSLIDKLDGSFKIERIEIITTGVASPETTTSTIIIADYILEYGNISIYLFLDFLQQCFFFAGSKF